jgi:hypothetical protein
MALIRHQRVADERPLLGADVMFDPGRLGLNGTTGCGGRLESRLPRFTRG